jgi:succinate-semialdehyde dehydrogenase/glutarate-semialdehyde dehydrogenase
LLTEVFDSAGYEDGIKTVWNFCIHHQQAARLIQDSRVHGVTLTGSTQAGAQVGAIAGGAIKKSVLELGGSDAYLVMADANLNLAAEKCAASRLTNSGQSCIAAKRFIVDHKVLDSFLEKFVLALQKPKIGNPLQGDSELGPLAAKKFQLQLNQQVLELEKAGARRLAGKIPDIQQVGAYFHPMVLQSNAELWNQQKDLELFGPVAQVVSFKTEEEMLALANNSAYGLGAGLFTQDLERASWLMESGLECGMVVLNDFLKSDARVPFGGVKKSGYGRELGEVGLFEFANIKVCQEG